SVHRCGRNLVPYDKERRRQRDSRANVMKILRALLLASAVGTGSIVSVAAQQPATPSPETLAVAKELVALMSGDLVNDMAGKASAQALPPIEQGFPPPYPPLHPPTPPHPP